MAVQETPRFVHIVRKPSVQGGEPTIVGTRIPVRAIVVAARGTPDVAYLSTAYPPLTPALIQEALAFYHVHRAEIDALIAANEDDLD